MRSMWFHFSGLIAWALLAPTVSLYSQVTAQPTAWAPLGPVGGPVRSLTADPVQPGVLYATAGTHGTFKSVDGGAHWFLANRGLPAGPGLLRSVAVDPSNRNVLYLGTLTGVLRSLDAGGSWQPASNGLPGGLPLEITALAALRRPAGTALAGTAAGLYRTTNRGASWSRPAKGLPSAPVAALAVAPSEPQTVYVLLYTGLFRSKDAGASWKQVVRPPAEGQIYSLAVDPRSPSTLYASSGGGTVLRSTDGAAHWSVAGRLPGFYPLVLTADPFRPRRVYAGLSPEIGFLGGVFRSEDGGATWQRRSQGYFAVETTAFAADPGETDQLWTGVPSGPLFHSSNRGLRWTRAPLPAGLLPAPRGLAASSAAVFVVTIDLLASGGALWKTADDGASWVRILSTERPSALRLFRLALSEPATLYALVEPGPFNDRGIDILRTTDGGASWETRAAGLSTLQCGIGDLAVNPSAAGTLYLAGAGFSPAPVYCYRPVARVLRSTDGGVSWTDAGAGLPSGFVARVAVDPNDPDTVYAGFGRTSLAKADGLWKSADRGVTWTRAGNELAGRSITALLAAAVPGRVYAARDDGHVFRSADGGESWQDVTAGLLANEVSALAADPGDPDRVYAVTTNGIWVLAEAP